MGWNMRLPEEPEGETISERGRPYWKSLALPEKVLKALELAEELGARRMKRSMLSAVSRRVLDSDLLELSHEQIETFNDLMNWCCDKPKPAIQFDELLVVLDEVEKSLNALRQTASDAFAMVQAAREKMWPNKD